MCLAQISSSNKAAAIGDSLAAIAGIAVAQSYTAAKGELARSRPPL
ncbi:MAG: hypothetical protein ACR2P4_03405 [Gammaproteobacteria bacterium]